MLATFCGSQTPAPVDTSGPYALIRFHSDASETDTGFLITYTSNESKNIVISQSIAIVNDCCECGCVLWIHESCLFYLVLIVVFHFNIKILFIKEIVPFYYRMLHVWSLNALPTMSSQTPFVRFSKSLELRAHVLQGHLSIDFLYAPVSWCNKCTYQVRLHAWRKF